MSYRTFLLPGLALVLLLVLVALPRTDREAEEAPPLDAPPSVEAHEDRHDSGGDTNPWERWAYEQERLQDPRTGRIPANIRARELRHAARLPTVERMHQLGKRAAAAPSDAWTMRGPTNISGRTRALAYDVSDPDVFLAGGVSGGVWRSTNAGQSWTKQTAPNQLPSVTTIAQDTRPGHTDTWFYGAGERLYNSASDPDTDYLGDGIFRSTDGGFSWTPLASTVSGTPEALDGAFDMVYRVAVDPSAPTGADSRVLAATHGGIYYSDDAGDSWTRVLGDGVLNDEGTYFTDIVYASDGTAYAALTADKSDGAAWGVYRSADGVTWTEIRSVDNTWHRTVLALAPSDETQLYVLAAIQASDDVFLHHYTYRGGDGTSGDWTDLSANVPNGLPGIRDFNSQNGYNLMVAVDPADAGKVFIGGTSLYVSTDGFTTQNNINQIGGYDPDPRGDGVDNYRYPQHHPDLHAQVFLPDGSVLSGHDGGVSWTDDPYASRVEWEFRNTGYVTTQFYTVAIDEATPGDQRIVGGMQDNGSWVATGTSTEWGIVTASDGTMTAVSDGGANVYSGTQSEQIWRSQLDATGAVIDQVQINPCRLQDVFLTPYALDPSDDRSMYVASGASVLRHSDVTSIPLTNTGCTNWGWTRLSNLGNPDNSWITVLKPVETPSEGTRLYFGTWRGAVYYADNAQTGDPTPIDITGANFPAGYVSSIAVDPENVDHVLVAFSNYGVPSLFYTLDGGASWIDVSGNLEENPDGSGSGPSVRWVEMLVDGGETTYFAATSTGLYSTTSLRGGATEWAQEGATTIGNVVTEMVRVRQDAATSSTDAYLAVATHGGGVYDIFYPAKKIAGTIRDVDGRPVADVVLDGLPGTPVTDADGRYEVRVDWQWTGAVRPAKEGYRFNPSSITYANQPFDTRPFEDFVAVPEGRQEVPAEALALWLKDAGTAVVVEDGEATATQWADQSGQGHDLVQLARTRRPAWSADGFMGHAAVTFDGIDDLLSTSSFSLDGADEATAFVVFRTDEAQDGSYLLAMPEAASGLNGFDLQLETTRVRSHLQASGFTTTEAVETYYDGEGNDTWPHVVTARFWPPGLLNTHRIYYDGRERGVQTNSGAIQASAGQTHVGAFSTEYGAHFSGDVAEVIVYSRSLGTAERSAVENYLGLKYRLGWDTAADPSISSSAEGVYVLGTTDAAVHFSESPARSGSLDATTGTDPSVVGELPEGVAEVLPDRFWSIDAALSDYTYSITLDLSDVDLAGVSTFDELTVLRRADAESAWEDVGALEEATLVRHAPYLTASGLASFGEFAIGVLGGDEPAELQLSVLADPGVVVPAGGGSFTYDASVLYQGAAASELDAWVVISGPIPDHTVGPRPVTLEPGTDATYTLKQFVPGGAPAGTYTLTLNLGTFPVSQVSDRFEWEKGVGTSGAVQGDQRWTSDLAAAFAQPTATSTTPTADLPETYALEQNYPNPFNPMTTIAYELPEAGPVAVRVLNMLGQEVAVLVDGRQEAGRHEVRFDARHLSAGVYLYTLESGAHRSTRRMVLLK